MLDVLIIGAGICGSATAYYLSRYDLDICVVDREVDVSMGTTKANSAIIHAGYDPEPGTLLASLNVEGNRLCGELASELGFAFRRIGSYVLAFSAEDDETVKKLYERGIANGVPGLEIHTKEQIKANEPNVSDSVTSGLYAPSAGIVSPWGYCLALAENAAVCGARFALGHGVTDIKRKGGAFAVTLSNGEVLETRYIVNCAGIHAAEICGMLGEKEFEIFPSKGQYFLLDKNQSGIVSHVMFQCPSAVGKGVLVSPTAGGNLIVGPNAESGSEPDDLSTDAEGLDFVAQAAARTTEKINYRENVRCFAGLRANSDRKDFIIEPSKQDAHFINVAGIKSPGLSAAPAIAKYVVSLLSEQGLVLNEKSESEIKHAPRRVSFAKASPEQREALIASDERYGSIVCRCNTVTEAEVVAACHSPIPPVSLDGIKRRAGTGMGRCQGGFCSPRVHEIISRELGIAYEDVIQEKEGSYIVCGRIGDECDD